MREQAPAILDSKSVMNGAAWANGGLRGAPENGRAAPAALVNLLADSASSYNGMAAMPFERASSPFAGGPRSSSPFGPPPRPGSGLSNGGAAPVPAPPASLAIKVLHQSVSQQGSLGSQQQQQHGGGAVDHPSHSQPGSPSNSMGSPKVALGRSGLGLPAGYGDPQQRLDSPSVEAALQGLCAFGGGRGVVESRQGRVGCGMHEAEGVAGYLGQGAWFARVGLEGSQGLHV
jgi:hypothetical protein